MECLGGSENRLVTVCEAADAIISGVSRTGSVQVVSGSCHGVTLCLQKIKVELSQHAHVFYSSAIELSYEFSAKHNSLIDLLKQEGISQTNGIDIVILIDHYSEIGLVTNSVLDQLLSKTLLPDSYIVLGCSETSCRGDSSLKLRLIHRSPEEDCTELLYLLNGPQRSDIMVKFILSNCKDLCSNINLIESSLLLFDRESPKTLSSFTEALLLKVMKSEAKCLNSLSTKVHFKFLSLCKLAYTSINEKDGIDYQDASRCLTLDMHTGAFSSMKGASMGLLLYPQNAEETAEGKCIFKHKLLKEFMAAYYIANEPLLCQISIFNKNKLQLDSRLCRLYFGMGHLLSNGNHARAREVKSEIHHVYYCLLTSSEIESTVSNTADLDRVSNIYKLLYESQNSDLVRKVSSRLQNHLVMKLVAYKLSDFFIMAVTYVISNSGIPKWSVSSHESLKNTADFISLKVKSSSLRRVEVQTCDLASEEFVVQPIVTNSSNTKSKTSLQVSTYVKCMEEVMHEVLQLYFPYKIQSSSSDDSSYISFWGCDCLRRQLEESQVFKFEPIVPFTWLESTVGKRHTKSTSAEVLRFVQHLSSHHDMKQTEIIIMTTPFPVRLHYIEPHSFIKRSIELYFEKPEQQFFNCIVEVCDGIHSNYDTVFSSEEETVVPQNETRCGSSEVVLPNLPIPKSRSSGTKDEVKIPAPVKYKVTFKESPELKSMHHAKPKRDNDESHNIKTNLAQVLEAKPPVKSHSSRIQKDGERNLVASETKAAIESRNRVTFRRPVAFDAGTVLYSTIPDILSEKVKYPCPKEDQLIKKGGNGNIYFATYGHYDFVVKKTPYRSLEIEIHKMLKHPNIVELKCLMFGYEQPLYRRRYFCYHFMPKYTADLCCLVTGKPDLTMVNLSVKHKDNLRLLGSIQGNWKYILKEILKGLAYMHSKSIIHRDIKTSNILIKMYCNCDVLTCMCHHKYSVCITDFDAAVMLNSEGKIPPKSNLFQYHIPRDQREVYLVMPMGTDGYRAPETFQMIISSDYDLFDPPLTTKADIWSYGLILLKMLNGATGPSRQRKLSLLLLYYEQQKRCDRNEHPRVSQFPGRRLPSVLRTEVDSAIGLAKLHSVDNLWIRKALECITKCLEVDPNRRPDAECLLRDPFLY